MAPTPEDNPKIKAVYDALESDSARAVAKAEEAIVAAKGDRKAEGFALNAMALALVSQAVPESGKALEKANEALSIFKELNDNEAQTYVYSTIITTKLVDKRNPEARQVARDAVAFFHKANDIVGEASAQLLLSQACLSTGKTADAVSAALDAVILYKQVGERQGQADALLAVVSADLTSDQAIAAASERVSLFKHIGDSIQEAGALVTLAEAHLARMGEKLTKCSIASVEDTMSALTKAKDAYALYQESGYHLEGMDRAMRAVQRVLLLNGVSPERISNVSNPETVFQEVMSGAYSTSKNAFPAKPQPKQMKLEEIIPSAKQLERGNFNWTGVIGAGYSYTLIWQAAKDRDLRGKKPRDSYDLMTLNNGARSSSLAQCFTANANDCADRSTPLVVYMNSHDASTTYGSTIMSTQNTLAAMITARVSKICFVQFDESHVDWTDTRCRQMHIFPVTLAMIRSCRIENPQVSIGYVCGDTASWMADPAPLIESLFDTMEQDENELVFKRGEAYAPLLIHRPQDDLVTYVKPKKGKNAFCP